ncbi:uncharacterized protein DNG_05462 [Cephalotrichum gorgonifer]|uniref:Uncharacterized protein n=1 Tax=Cephalotrichum gorgonifer TaxID=2041049 RepID=A0AAE8N0Y1_9PEZI|nr:uncharacterized protein DNG_05462 [Cephalotrichum gorgonifer]
MLVPKQPGLGFFSKHASDAGPGHPHDAGPVRRGAIEAIGLGGAMLLNAEYMSKWGRYTDFNVLRSLHLRTEGIEASVLDYLFNISKTDRLGSLRCLSLWTGDYLVDDQVDVDSSLARLLRSLRPLDSLELTGIFGEDTFDSVLCSHGESLGKLRLVPTRVPSPVVRPFVLSRGRVEALVRACPGITELKLLVPRRKGDEEEARTYRALSGLRRLDRLSLRLDCSGVQESEDGVRQNADGPYWQVRDMHDGAINVTVDADLVTVIFNAICAHRLPQLIRLYPAEIKNPLGDHLIDNLYFPAACLSRVWIGVRDPRAGWEREFKPVELRARYWEGAEERVESTPGAFSFLLDIWPDSGGDIRKMPSFPLWDGD